MARRLLGAALWLSALATCGPVPEGASEPGARAAPHVVLVMLDTLRADHLSCYGYARETSPRLDALALESILFEQARATSSSTAPSQLSILTGAMPQVHGVSNEAPGRKSARLRGLPELLAERGYATTAFADGGIVSAPYGFDVGFDAFDSRYEPFDAKLDRVQEWLPEAPEEPQFLFVHTYGVHAPYLPADGHDLFTDADYRGPLLELTGKLREFRASGVTTSLERLLDTYWALASSGRLTPPDETYLRDLYDGCIHGVDAGVGRLVDLLRTRGWLDDTWLIVTSDHGEAFGEHGTFSHRQLYEEELHVPLIVRPPGGADARRISTPVSQLDLAPTLLELLGLPVPPTMQGRSLAPIDAEPVARPVFSVSDNSIAEAVLRGSLKLIFRPTRRAELYALDADPGETKNLRPLPSTDSLRLELRGLLDARRAASLELRGKLGDPVPPGEALDPEQLAELRALGYLK